MKNLFQILYEVLKQDKRFISQEGDLLKNVIREEADKLDGDLIWLLFNNKDTKKAFFKSLNYGSNFEVFDSKKFIQFINNKEFLPDSYTSFKNKIGLTNSKGDLLNDNNDVVLSFPYKDCILAGGQDKEDVKRDEVFYNEILGNDDIDRLLDEKVFTNFKRIDKTGEHKLDGFKRDENGTIKDNLIIKGNNLLALHSLKSSFAGKLDLIYIDPPYNTGGNGDTFEYNNRFKHSSWLTFMKNRLDIAKNLLKKEGVLIVAIDKAEQVYLGVLLDEIFPEYESHCITIVHNPRGVQGTNFSYTHEFAFFIIPKDKKTVLNRKIAEEDIKNRGLRDNGGESKRTDAKNCFYSIIADKKTLQVIGFGNVCSDGTHPQVNVHDGDFVEIYPIDKEGVERKWRYARQSIEEVQDL
ncbi:site-specific DNA-methyltransferase, partial [Candidatus Gracilibacteria bacterium]|nr:site-specific DNA-methyltransferase [Candidatus Gracilibacteria bacterium]